MEINFLFYVNGVCPYSHIKENSSKILQEEFSFLATGIFNVRKKCF